MWEYNNDNEAFDKVFDELVKEQEGPIKLSDLDPYDRAFIEKFPDQIDEILD